MQRFEKRVGESDLGRHAVIAAQLAQGRFHLVRDVAREHARRLGRVEVFEGPPAVRGERGEIVGQRLGDDVLVDAVREGARHAGEEGRMAKGRLSRGWVRRGAPSAAAPRYLLPVAGEDIREAVREALAIVMEATGLGPEELFGERVLGELTHLPPPAAHAAGVLEGIGVALGLTTLELLGELSLNDGGGA